MNLEECRPLICARLAGREPAVVPFRQGQRRAAVAIVLAQDRGAAHLTVVKRVGRGRNAGQWALPGGRQDPGETNVQTALREVAEEVGLSLNEGDVLGVLDDVDATSGFVITPVVAVAPAGQRMRRNPAEIASIHPIALDRLIAPGVPRWKRTADGHLLQMPLRHDMVVHAPTGAILWQFAQVALRGINCRTADLLEPDFARC